MLTRSDQTVSDCLEVLEEIRPLNLRHVGFKDVGVTPQTLMELNKRIKATGAVSYMEVVSTSRESALNSARVAREIGVDCLLGGTLVEEILGILEGSAVKYYPFPGRPFNHPTKLAGSAEEVEAQCRKYEEMGCAGVDLLAYRATEADPLDLVRAARKGTKGTLIIAGSVSKAEQIRKLKEAGADAFTVGSAAFDGSYSPLKGGLKSQLRDIQNACEGAGEESR